MKGMKGAKGAKKPAKAAGNPFAKAAAAKGVKKTVAKKKK